MECYLESVTTTCFLRLLLGQWHWGFWPILKTHSVIYNSIMFLMTRVKLKPGTCAFVECVSSCWISSCNLFCDLFFKQSKSGLNIINWPHCVCFSGCDVNSPRKPGPNGEGEEEAHDGQTPLHLAACWGLEEVIQCLLEFGANVNAQVCEQIMHSFLK